MPQTGSMAESAADFVSAEGPSWWWFTLVSSRPPRGSSGRSFPLAQSVGPACIHAFQRRLGILLVIQIVLISSLAVGFLEEGLQTERHVVVRRPKGDGQGGQWLLERQGI